MKKEEREMREKVKARKARRHSHESGNPEYNLYWIPACARMTKKAGMTKRPRAKGVTE
jgi:hypothetical protein